MPNLPNLVKIYNKSLHDVIPFKVPMVVRGLLASLFINATLLAYVNYDIDVQGVSDHTTSRLIKNSSDLFAMKNKPPVSMRALKFRIENDLPKIREALEANGYFEAKVTYQIQSYTDSYNVLIEVEPGPQYRLAKPQITILDAKGKALTFSEINPSDLEIKEGSHYRAIRLLDAESNILSILHKSGYPMCKLLDKKVIADGKTHLVKVQLTYQSGPLLRFGEVHFIGNTEVLSSYLMKKLKWQKGEEYNSEKIDQTQASLLDSGLFGSVIIKPGDEALPNGEIPIYVELFETKHRSVNAGVSYQTFYGFGLAFGWQHRNIGGQGRRFSLQGEITSRSRTGLAQLVIPDLQRIGQNLVLEAEAMYEHLTAYTQHSYYSEGRLERLLGKKASISFGAKIEELHVTDSVDNQNYTLLEIPIFVRLSNANSLLNPTRGASMEAKTVPTFSLHDSKDYYIIQQVIGCYYHPFDRKDKVVFAQKATIGLTTSRSLNKVPVPKRFLGGSEEDLRGYKYRTVSKRAPSGKPIGGRSAIYYSAELRFRLSKTIGLVPFYDLGTVEERNVPRLSEKWYQSAGLGLRYFSFLGPLRCDIGVPLNRRKGFDPRYRFLLSIGQTF